MQRSEAEVGGYLVRVSVSDGPASVAGVSTFSHEHGLQFTGIFCNLRVRTRRSRHVQQYRLEK